MANEPGHWLYLRNLGAGAFGVVQLWRNDYTNEMIAVKKCKGDSRQLTEKQRDRWVNEVQTMNSLKHPNIVATRRVPEQLTKLQDKLPVLCMEYCSRGDLRMLLNQSQNCCGIEEREALRIMRDVASAVEYLHSRNFTHRDLKPENIVVQGFGEKITYKLTDLGYVCELGETTVDRSAVGTLNYLAPELLWKDGYTCSVDYWSLGVLFYEIVTGNRPFFPDMNVTPTWIDYMKRKRNEHISGRKEDDRVVFSSEIESPTTISDCMRNELTTWFRVALQWDPKSRGRIKNDRGYEELIVFTHLKSMVSWKIIHVFAVPFYRVDSYAVNPRVSVHELKNFISEKTGIDVADQVLSDTRCNILSEPDSHVINCTEDSNLIVFKKESPSVEMTPIPNISLPVRRMIDEPRKLFGHETIRRYYGAAVFFLRQELQLFRSYVISLSIKIDMSNMSLENLREIVKNLTTSANTLMRDLNLFEQETTYGRLSEELRGSLGITKSKTQDLLDGTDQVDSNMDALSRDFENLKTFSETNWLENWTFLLDKATGYLEAITKSGRFQPSPPLEMVKLLYDALKLRKDQLNCAEIDSIVSRIKDFDNKISRLQAALSSFERLVDLYRENYEDVRAKGVNEESNSCFAFIESMTPYDAVIYDNIFLRNLIESLESFNPSVEDMEDLDF